VYSVFGKIHCGGLKHNSLYLGLVLEDKLVNLKTTHFRRDDVDYDYTDDGNTFVYKVPMLRTIVVTAGRMK
jgi:hypothetical protein